MARGQHRSNRICLLLVLGEVFEMAALAACQIYKSSTTSASAEGIMYQP